MAHFAKIGIDNVVLSVHTFDNILCMTRGGIEREDIGVAHLKKFMGMKTGLSVHTGQKQGIVGRKVKWEDLEKLPHQHFVLISHRKVGFGTQPMKFFILPGQRMKMEMYVTHSH